MTRVQETMGKEPKRRDKRYFKKRKISMAICKKGWSASSTDESLSNPWGRKV